MHEFPAISSLQFDAWAVWKVGGLLVVLVVILMGWVNWRGGPERKRGWVLTGLRSAALLMVLFLLARPVWVKKLPEQRPEQPVVVLLDRSESMSIDDGNGTRLGQAREFVMRRLGPALSEAGVPVRYLSFAEAAEVVRGDRLGNLTPDGKRTDLAGAVVEAMGGSIAPVAVIACTDGSANETAGTGRALAALAGGSVPFIGIGFGSDRGIQTLALRQADAPAVIAPGMEFNVSAYLEAMNLGSGTKFDLVLFRDGVLLEQKTIEAAHGSRVWIENFRVTERLEGYHRYSVQLMPPSEVGLKSLNRVAEAAVRVQSAKELRVLFVQGALTWDYKFIALALKSDPTIKVTGLSRTSKHSIFRQNVESAGELVNGFPSSLSEMAPFRVVVLSNLKPADLTVEQQELLGQFCAELGGGLVLMGGSATFDQSWKGSRLEKMLPVVFSSESGVRGLDRSFRLQLTRDALQHPMFQISHELGTQQAWSKIPAFTQYARVQEAKPGAQVWAEHSFDSGPRGKRILIASQRYGAGQTAVLCVQNFWRWRLGKDSEPQQFDRFWKQFFRFLGEARREDVAIHLAEQDLRPQSDVQVIVEKQPAPKNSVEVKGQFTVVVENPEKKRVQEQSIDLAAGRPVEVKFRAETAGLYAISVQGLGQQVVASRSVDVRELNREFQSTARNMEHLRQWAAASAGLAVAAEDCPDAAALLRRIRGKVTDIRQSKEERTPAGMDPWFLAALLGCLGGEWLLRKRWSLI